MTAIKTNKLMKTISIFILLALLAGCAAQPTAATAPTVDTVALRTQVAQTVIANPTIQSALNPPATPTTPPTVAPTQAPVAIEPTQTIAPIVAVATTTATEPVPTVTFTAVATQTKVFLPTVPQSDQALLMYAQPAAYTHFQPRTPFDAVWTFKNVGMKTWTNEYFLTFAGGEEMVTKGEVAMVSGKVKPGTTTQLVLDMVAPSSPGTYTAKFAFYNDNRFVFGTFYIVIIVD
jgi:Ig-like domain from next to BRCA1 gene